MNAVRVLVQPEHHGSQLQPGGPTLGPVDQGGDLVGPQWPSGDALQKTGRIGIVEGQLGLADLGQSPTQAVAAPGDGRVHPCRQDEVDVGGRQLDEPAQIGEQGGVGQLVEIVQHQDRLGQLGQEPGEGFQERGPQSASVEGHQLAQLGRLGVHRGQSLQEALREADRVVV